MTSKEKRLIKMIEDAGVAVIADDKKLLKELAKH